MEFKGQAHIAADRAAVWAVLLDVDKFAACMPGVENISQIDERSFEGSINAAVGPISGKFTFTATILEANEPTDMTAQIDGRDSVTKSQLIGTSTMRLTPDGPNTLLEYHATVEVKGRLAILGDMILRTTATLLLEEFTKRLRKQVEGA